MKILSLYHPLFQCITFLVGDLQRLDGPNPHKLHLAATPHLGPALLWHGHCRPDRWVGGQRPAGKKRARNRNGAPPARGFPYGLALPPGRFSGLFNASPPGSAGIADVDPQVPQSLPPSSYSSFREFPGSWNCWDFSLLEEL